MIRIALFLTAACLFLFSSTQQANAQYYGYGAPNYGSPYNNPYGYGYQGSGYSHPMLGYCLKNDCYDQGGVGYGGCGHGYGCGSPSVTVRVRVSGSGGTPAVQTYYPQVHGCYGGYYGNNRNQQSQSRFVGSSPQHTPATRPANVRQPAPANNAPRRYQYKF